MSFFTFWSVLWAAVAVTVASQQIDCFQTDQRRRPKTHTLGQPVARICLQVWVWVQTLVCVSVSWPSADCSPASATIYARYKFVQSLADLRLMSPRLNKAALGIGMLSCFGMCVVATFQVSDHTCWHKNSPSLKKYFKYVCFSFHLFFSFIIFFAFLRKQRWQMLIELERCSSLCRVLFIWSSSVLYHAIPLRLDHPSLCAECAWASPY